MFPSVPENHIEPGGPDQGQPTHFYPRRNMFLFTIRVPKDFGEKELVWTLVTQGKTERTFASLKPDYLLNKQTIATEVGANMAGLGDELVQNGFPVLTVEGDKRRTAKVREPLTLVARVADDGIPSGTRQTRAPARGARRGSRRRNRKSGARTPELQAADANCSGDAEWNVAFVDCVSWPAAGLLRSTADEDLAGHPNLRELPVVASVHHAAGSSKWEMGSPGELRRARHLRASCDCERWGLVRRRERAVSVTR